MTNILTRAQRSALMAKVKGSGNASTKHGRRAPPLHHENTKPAISTGSSADSSRPHGLLTKITAL